MAEGGIAPAGAAVEAAAAAVAVVVEETAAAVVEAAVETPPAVAARVPSASASSAARVATTASASPCNMPVLNYDTLPMNKRTLFQTLIGASALALVPFALAEEKEMSEMKKADGEVTDIKIILKTNKGDIPATMYASKAPLTVANFLNLASNDYYDGIVFHRVIPNFMIQGGDPTGTGRGGPGYKIKDEFAPGLKHNRPGLFSMANAGANTGGSQFFITHVPTPHLDGKHAIFGEVTGDGQKVVDSIVKGDTITDIEIIDSTDPLFAAQKANIEKWDEVLKKDKAMKK